MCFQSFLERQVFLNRRLFQTIRFQYFHKETAVSPYYCYLFTYIFTAIAQQATRFPMVEGEGLGEYFPVTPKIYLSLPTMLHAVFGFFAQKVTPSAPSDS